jgi:hypothetical protein
MYEQNQPSGQEIKIVMETSPSTSAVQNPNPPGTIQVRPAALIPLNESATVQTFESTVAPVNLKSNKPPAHIKDLIYYKYKNDNSLPFQTTSPSSSQIPSVTIQQTCSSPSTDSDQSTKQGFVSYSSDHLSAKSQKYSETLSPSNLSNSPPLGSSSFNSASFIKIGALTSLNDSQSSASSTASNFNSSSDNQAKLQAQQLQQQQLKKSTKKRTAQVANDLDEERTSQLVSDIIKNIKEKTKELESQNQSLKTLTSNTSTSQVNESASPQCVTTPPLTNSTTVSLPQAVMPIITLNPTPNTTVNKVNITNPTTFPCGLKSTTVAATTSNSPQALPNNNVCFSLIQPLNKIGSVFSTSGPVSAPIFTQIHPIDASAQQIGHFQPKPSIITQSFDSQVTTDPTSASLHVPQVKKAKKPAVSRVKSIEVPLGWSRTIEITANTKEKKVVYKSPTCVALNSIQEIKAYLLSDNTCKCGLECPLNVNTRFNFDPTYESKLIAIYDRGKKSDSDSCSCQNYSNSTEVLEKFARDNLDSLKKKPFGEALNSNAAKRPSSAKAGAAKTKKPREDNSLAVTSPAYSDSSNSQGFYPQNTQPILLSSVIVNAVTIENASTLRKSPTSATVIDLNSSFVCSTSNVTEFKEEKSNF